MQKIAFFHNLPSGGAKRVVYDQIKYLSKYYLVDLYTLSSNDSDFLNFNDLNCKIYTYSFNSESNLRLVFNRIERDYKNFVILKQIHKKMAEDINKRKYHAVILHHDKFTQSPFLLRFLRTQSIYYCEEWYRIIYEKKFAFNEKVSVLNKKYELFTRGVRKKIDKTNLSYAKNIICNSIFTQQNIKKAYNLESSVIYPSVDISIFRPQGIAKEFDIVFVGEQTKLEGYTILEASLLKFQKKPVLKIVNTRLQGKWINDKDLAKIYNKAKVVVALAKDEPFGLIPIEAMACGVPVIAVNEGGYKESVLNNKTGLCIRRNVDQLYFALNKILTDTKMREELGRNAREHALDTFSIEVIGKQLVDCIKNIQ